VALYKAIKVELKFLCENTLETNQALDWVLDAMEKFCDFYAAEVKLVQEHHNVMPITDEDDKASA